MSTFKLLHPVYTLDKKQLLPAGSELTPGAEDALISSKGKNHHAIESFMDYGSVKEDILDILGQPPYQVIFSDKEQFANVMNSMETVRHPIPILQSQDYFKEHDFYTYRHILVVFALSLLLTRDLVPDSHERNLTIAAGSTHDLGKICVPIDVLKKSEPLTRVERNILEHHAAAGYVLLCYYLKDRQNLASTVARDHHERLDGSGYPRGIKIRDPIVEIVAACDVYDALISLRPYRPISYDNRTALEEITAMAEKNKIGWDVVKALIAQNRADKPHFSEIKISFDKRGTPPPNNRYGVLVK